MEKRSCVQLKKGQMMGGGEVRARVTGVEKGEGGGGEEGGEEEEEEDKRGEALRVRDGGS